MEIKNTKTYLDPEVATAFGISSDIALLPGGIDLKTFRSGNVVLRYLGVDAQDVAIWHAELFDRIIENGFRVAKPIRAANGSWMVKGWVAEHFLEGRHATKEDLPSVIDAATKFREELVGVPFPEFRNREQTMWDRADQWAWGDIPEDIDPKLYRSAIDLAELRRPADLSNQVIHGDLNLNNVLIADHQPPAIIDLAPYFRPAEFALAVTAYWVGPYEEDIKVLHQFRSIRSFDQMLIRAGLRMMLTQKDHRHAIGIEKYQKANEIIQHFVKSN